MTREKWQKCQITTGQQDKRLKVFTSPYKIYTHLGREGDCEVQALVTLAPIQVSCAKLETLPGEVVGQVMVVPDESEMHVWAIGSVACVALSFNMEMMMLANLTPFTLMLPE